MKIKCILILISAICLMGCGKEESSPSNGNRGTSQSGSLALYAFHDNYMYKISGHSLSIYNVSDAKSPIFIKEMEIEPGIETIMVDQYLFFGSRTGLIVYSIDNPEAPSHITTYSHVTSCDPVIIDGNYAYVTLSAQTMCRGVNELHVIDISDIYNLKLVGQMWMDKPQGLASNGKYLYICEGEYGLTILDKSTPSDVKLVKNMIDIHVVDAIFKDNTLTLRGPDGIYKFDCTDPINLVQIAHVEAK